MAKATNSAPAIKSDNGAPIAIEQIPIEDLVPYEKNARSHPLAQIAKIASSIREFGFIVPCLIDTDNVIIAGHGRVLGAKEAGLRIAPCIRVDNLTPAQVKAFRLMDNRVGQDASWLDDILKDELSALKELDFDLSLTGFDDKELKSLLVDQEELQRLEEATPEPPEIPVTVRGDVWTCGRHRVMCGDSLSITDVERLTGGVVPDLAHCDPPYGISVVKGSSVGGAKPFGKVGGGKPHPFAGKKQGRVHGPAKNAIIEPGVYAPIIGDDSTVTAVESYKTLMALGVPIIVLWGGNYFCEQLPPSRCWYVWDKENTGSFADAELAWTNQDKIVRLFRHQWSGLIKASERGERRVHPTQKPIALAEWVFETAAPKANTVIDLFLGSASTLIGAERQDLTCFGMEMSEAYADVAVIRWSNLTGQQAILEGDGRTFDEIKAERLKGKDAA